jgi:hypothetical protein
VDDLVENCKNFCNLNQYAGTTPQNLLQHTSLVLLIQICLHYARVNDENEISQCFIMIWTLVLPALIEEFIELIPFFKFEHCLKLELYNLEVLRDDVCLSRAAKLIDAFCGGVPELLAVLPNI